MVKNIISIVQTNIKTARRDANLTLDQLATMIGVSHNVTIARYENGERKPDIETLFKISEATSKPIDWFFRDSDENLEKQEEKTNEELDFLDKIKELDHEALDSLFEYIDFLLWKIKRKVD